MAILTILATLILAILGRVIGDEAKAWLPWIATRIKQIAVRRLPPQCRSRYEEEWESDLLSVPGDLSKILYAVSLLRGAAGISVLEMDISPWTASAWRRCLEMGLAALGIWLLGPMMIAAGTLTRLLSHGPAILVQTRVGRGGRKFKLLKFRTMNVARGYGPRITPIGGILRRYRIDLLPQLFNVLRGDMSLVGPPALKPGVTEMNMPCRPGITGPSTIAAPEVEKRLLEAFPELNLKSGTFFEEILQPAKVRVDIEFMRTATLVSDLKMLWRAVTAPSDKGEDEAEL
jgi:lipopolysaccharide/colanic/teichoic acid biosynthesis glycosyltransferase